jgi:type II secretory pathway pseudopilin PulG
MKQFRRALGVTLLEVMLVLAIAAMIIVMSVRYYQSASYSQQANTVLQQIQSIVAGADSIAQGKGTYSGITMTTLKPLLPGGGTTTPWGEEITVLGSGPTKVDITIPTVPAGVCPLLLAKFAQNESFTIGAAKVDPSTCGTTAASHTLTYTSNP